MKYTGIPRFEKEAEKRSLSCVTSEKIETNCNADLEAKYDDLLVRYNEQVKKLDKLDLDLIWKDQQISDLYEEIYQTGDELEKVRDLVADQEYELKSCDKIAFLNSSRNLMQTFQLILALKMI